MTAPFVSLPHSLAHFPPLSYSTSFRDPTDLLCNPAPNLSERFTGWLHPSTGTPQRRPLRRKPGLSECLCPSRLLKAGNSITRSISAMKETYRNINRVSQETLVEHTILHVPQQSNYLGFVCCELQVLCAVRTCTPILPSAAQHADRGADS